WRAAVGFAGAALFFFSLSGGVMWDMRRRAAARTARVTAVPDASGTPD
ncbi:hypothetical protein HUK84_12425, partial [Nguyenibacter vanlangensis]|nr:hypothetical protein [Nguyenibacter vanlangensis]